MESATANKKPEVTETRPNTVRAMQPEGSHARRPYGFLQSINSWIFPPDDSNSVPEDLSESIDWVRAVAFFAMQLSFVLVFFVGWSWLAIGVAVFLYALRVFTLTGFYHLYFSHRTFKTWRMIQFLFFLREPLDCAHVCVFRPSPSSSGAIRLRLCMTTE
jgi:hypothetical protein